MQKRNYNIAKAVIEKEGTFLLGKREAGAKSYPGTWDFFGGQLDPGETPAESVIRETMEETSLSIEPGPKIKETQYEDDTHILRLHYFIPTVVEDRDIVLCHEHTEYGWFTREEIKNLPLHPSVSVYFA